MKKFMDWMEKHFVPLAGRVGTQKHLSAIRDGFVVVMPLIILGSFGVLINYLQFTSDAATDPYQTFMAGLLGPNWQMLGNILSNVSFGVLSLLVCASVAYNFGKQNGKDPIATAIVALASLLAVTNMVNGGIPLAWLGARGLFVSIFVALGSADLFNRLLGNEKLIIKMPDGVPPAVARSFAALLPSFIVVVLFGLIKVTTLKFGIEDIHLSIYNMIQGPLGGLSNTVGAAVLLVFLNSLLWSFGLHGSNILAPITGSLFLPASEANLAAFQAGLTPPNVVTLQFFETFIFMGGSGATICLVLAILAFSKKKEQKMIAKLGSAPGIFNINEPIMFGLPIVLNPIFIIPFVLTPVVLTFITYFAISTGLVPKTIAIVPWTMPPVFSGYLATGSIRGSLLQIVNIATGIFIYLPFLLMSKSSVEEGTESESETVTL